MKAFSTFWRIFMLVKASRSMEYQLRHGNFIRNRNSSGRRVHRTIVIWEPVRYLIRITRLAKTGNKIPPGSDALEIKLTRPGSRDLRRPVRAKRKRQRKRAIQSELIKSTNRNFTASRGHSISPGLSKAFVDAAVTCRELLAQRKVLFDRGLHRPR